MGSVGADTMDAAQELGEPDCVGCPEVGVYAPRTLRDGYSLRDAAGAEGISWWRGAVEMRRLS